MEPVGGPVRVIVIERSMGVQVGRDNDQASVYRVVLSQVSFESAQRLAETLLEPDAPWARDVFSHDVWPGLPDVEMRGPRRSTSSRINTGSPEVTLVIVRDSQGVQVGDHNMQRNEFTVRVRAVAIRADTLGMTPSRLGLIERLHTGPGDHDAAKLLAEDLAGAARAQLHADLTARVTRLAGNPSIRRRAGRFRHLVGRQIGGPGNRASIEVDVTGWVDTRALRRSLRVVADRRRDGRPGPSATRRRTR
jgi:hypothetical protein